MLKASLMLKKWLSNIYWLAVKNWQYLLLLTIVVLTYGRTIQMYWWVDDWGLLFKMIHSESSPGNLGPGIVGYGAYRYLATPFILLFPLVKYSTEIYFLLGILLYFIAVVLVYVFVKELTKDKVIPVLSASIFASGFIGSHALYRLTNSYQTVGATIFICLTVWLFAKHLRNGRLWFYWLSIILYIISNNQLRE